MATQKDVLDPMGVSAWGLDADRRQSTVAKYMVKRRGPPSQGWRAFLRNLAPDIATMDLFAVPTIGFNLLYAFVIVSRRVTTKIRVDGKPEDAGYFKQREDSGGIKVTSRRRHR